jgi:hypothetical protein
VPTVRLSAKDRKELAALIAAEGSPNACVVIHKLPSRADSKRTSDGGTSWLIDRSELWEAMIVSDERLTEDDITVIDGIRFWFNVSNPSGLPVLEVVVVDGQPHVRTAT